MIALFDAAQIERVLVLVGDDVAEAVHVERARLCEVRNAELDVARAHDVERRIEDGIAQGHSLPADPILSESSCEVLWSRLSSAIAMFFVSM